MSNFNEQALAALFQTVAQVDEMLAEIYNALTELEVQMESVNARIDLLEVGESTNGNQ